MQREKASRDWFWNIFTSRVFCVDTKPLSALVMIIKLHKTRPQVSRKISKLKRTHSWKFFINFKSDWVCCFSHKMCAPSDANAAIILSKLRCEIINKYTQSQCMRAKWETAFLIPPRAPAKPATQTNKS